MGPDDRRDDLPGGMWESPLAIPGGLAALLLVLGGPVAWRKKPLIATLFVVLGQTGVFTTLLLATAARVARGKFLFLALGYKLWCDARPHETRGGKPLAWARSLGVWRQVSRFFAAEIKRSEKMRGVEESAGPVVYVCHPHGVLAMASWVTFIQDREVFKEDVSSRRVAIVPLAFRLPIMREIALAMGCITNTKESIEAALDRELSVFVFGGGATEASLNAAGDEASLACVRLQLSQGLLRLCAHRGVPVVPIYTKGELGAFGGVPLIPGSLGQAFRRQTGFVPLLPVDGETRRWPLFPSQVKMKSLVGAEVLTENRGVQEIDEDLRAQFLRLLRVLDADASSKLVFVSKL